MKYLILSDIHGSLPRLRQVTDFFCAEHYDMMLILGDILNYGPRNGVPEGLDAPGIVSLLNNFSDKIIAVRGNCDAEVDQMLLQFPMMSDYAMVSDEGKKLFLTHGHIYNMDHSLPLFKGIDVCFTGHTHLWTLEKVEIEKGKNIIHCNTGSITFPKGGNLPTFATLHEGIIEIRDLEGRVLKEQSLFG